MAGHHSDSAATLKTRRTAAVLFVLLAALGLGCATAHNYLEPDSPRYAGGPGQVPREASPDGSPRVVTFNVAYARQITEAVAALRAQPLRGADVIALQEMDAPGTAAIAEALGLNYVYYPASRHPKTGRDFGNAILSPWPSRAATRSCCRGARASATRPAPRWRPWCAWAGARSPSIPCT